MKGRAASILLVANLTAKQIEAINLARRGLHQGEMAEELDVSPRQVYRILMEARRALGAKTNHELVAKAISLGLLDSFED